MRTTVCFFLAVVMAAALVRAQDKEKPVPKDSMRVYVPGCSKGMMFTAAPKTEDRAASVPSGTHLRMSGPKRVINEIKQQEGALIEITGIIRRGQFAQGGIPVGGGVRITPAPAGPPGAIGSPVAGQIMIDVEGWRKIPGECRG